MASPDNRELLGIVRAWAATNYPGCPLKFITIHLRHIKVPIRLAGHPGAAPAPAEEERGRTGLHPCTRAILALLREAGRPLTKSRLIELLDEGARGGRWEDWSESTINRRLAELMDDGTITNPDDARPRGYRLAE